MKRFLLFLIIGLLTMGTLSPVEAKTETKTNWQIVKEYCKKQGYTKIKVVESNKITDKAFWRIADHRKNKKWILVEKVVSVSDGTSYGWYSTKTKGTNYIIGYNKKVPKGKKVTSYVIWNPKSNVCDDILAVVDNRKIRS